MTYTNEMLFHKEKEVECVLKLPASESESAVGKRDHAKREQAALSSLPVHTRWRPLTGCCGGRDAISGGVGVRERLKRMGSSGLSVGVSFCNAADRKLVSGSSKLIGKCGR